MIDNKFRNLKHKDSVGYQKNVSAELLIQMQFIREISLAGLAAYNDSLERSELSFSQRSNGDNKKGDIAFEELLALGKEVEYQFSLKQDEEHISLSGMQMLLEYGYASAEQRKAEEINHLMSKIETLFTHIQKYKKSAQ